MRLRTASTALSAGVVGTSVGLILTLTLHAAAQPVFEPGAVAGAGGAGRVATVSPQGFSQAPGYGAGAVGNPGFLKPAGSRRFAPRRVTVQPGAAAPRAEPVAGEVRVAFGDGEAVNGFLSPSPYPLPVGERRLAAITPAELGQISAEQAWQRVDELFDYNRYARKAAQVPALLPPPPSPSLPPPAGGREVAESRTVNPSGKTETSKGRLPIHRPEEGGSNFEPGLYSVSRLGEFKWNREDYIRHWVFRVKRPTTIIDAFVGGIAHQTMENLSRWLTGGKTVDQVSLDDLIEIYNTLWDEQYDESKYHLGDDGLTLKDHRKRGEDFVRSMWQQFHPFDQGKILFIERKMFFTVDDTENGKKYRFQGIPDLVLLIQKPDGRKLIRVIDFKTTREPKTVDQLKKQDNQLVLYVSAIEQNFPDLAKDADWEVQWRYSIAPQTFAVTPEQREAVRERVVTLIHEIETAVAQVEANRAEWERRLNPVHPPKKMADAARLVDRWTKIQWKMDTLAEELKKLEAEQDSIIARLLDFAKKTGNATIPGRVKDAVLGEKEQVKVPTKTGDPEGYARVIALIKEAGLWEAFSSLDTAELKNMAKLAGHPHHALYEKIKDLVTIGMKKSLTLADRDEEPKKKKKK